MKMDYKDKLKGDIAGYVAVFLLFFIFGFTVYLMVMDIHFKFDTFITLLLVSIFKMCQDTYLDYRKKEKDFK